ncbi:disease resistance protein Roq1 [Lactuca sativa]|uniref:disease resistance protein Roq1 n=1 Tax=Lactuca sativa TaxID=4236 RepID=UPI000CB3FEFE|nr:disease resistance protein Roq1 [Lactuca sativa]XP_023757851.1 disease resistance protein Roq1 [Lactuca sativa]
MASSSPSSPSVPAFSYQLWKYHVFISFRGVDTRKNIVDHLYKALLQRGISTYKDDETLPRGELIRQSLMKAIKDSYIAIIVFSKNFANSSWCLEELSYIMKCRDTRGLIVIPIFHKVSPSVIQKCGEALFEHKLKNEKKAKSWRKALVYACSISGLETQRIANGHEAKCIEVIVDTILERLHQDVSNLNISNVNGNLIGIEARKQGLISAFELGFDGVCMVGIWGVGGGGKTTLASSVYDDISSNFDGCCFIKNVREESCNKAGLERLQEKILCGVLKQEQVHVTRVEEGKRMIKDRLHRRKVLIVLDDVDHLDQLEALAGSENWFGEGSRIIITTRDQHLLVAHRVNVIHDICLLNDDEATNLFRKHAPRNGRPIEDYELLSKVVVSYAGGLPLALNILGSFLCDKDMNEWRSALARLKEIPDANILEVLKISFDGLTKVEKELFLDIACFFMGREKDKAMGILEACGYHSVIGIKVLVQKALITISEDGEFDMHDLVQEMGHYIVRGEHPNNPEKHSRIWKKEDVLKICAMDATMVSANKKQRRWFGLNIKQRVKATRLLPEMFRPRELSGLTLSELVQKQLWDAYKAGDSVMLLPENNEMDYYNSVTRLDCGTSHGYDQTADSDDEDEDEDGDTRLNPVPKEAEKNDRIDREILKMLEKGKNKVEVEVVDQMETMEDRIVNRMKGFLHERIDRLEDKMVERMDMLENRMMKMEGIVVKRMERLTNKTVEMEGGVVQRIERLTNKMVERMDMLENRVGDVDK